MISPISRYLPIETEFNDEKFDTLKVVIKEKERILKRCRRGDIEQSLWTTEQLVYLRKMMDFNQNIRNNPGPKTVLRVTTADGVSEPHFYGPELGIENALWGYKKVEKVEVIENPNGYKFEWIEELLGVHNEAKKEHEEDQVGA